MPRQGADGAVVTLAARLFGNRLQPQIDNRAGAVSRAEVGGTERRFHLRSVPPEDCQLVLCSGIGARFADGIDGATLSVVALRVLADFGISGAALC